MISDILAALGLICIVAGIYVLLGGTGLAATWPPYMLAGVCLLILSAVLPGSRLR